MFMETEDGSTPEEYNAKVQGLLIGNGFKKIGHESSFSQHWRKNAILIVVKPETTPEEVQKIIDNEKDTSKLSH